MLKRMILSFLLVANLPAFSLVDEAKCNDFIRQIKNAITEFQLKNPRQYARCYLDEGYSYYNDVGNAPYCLVTEKNARGQLKQFMIPHLTSDEKANENLTYLKNYCAL